MQTKSNIIRILLIVVISVLGVFGIRAHAAQTAEARLYCLSMRFNRGAGPFGIYSLDLSGINSGINGELFPVFGGPRSHHSFLSLNDETFEPIPGDLDLNVPTDDVNEDGFPDIFDVSQPFAGGSSGTYSFPGQNGNVSATWSRGAGSTAGTCALTLPPFGTFNHTFTILEYTGPLSYTSGSNVVMASVDLTLTGAGNSDLKGLVEFTKSSTSPSNQLTRSFGSWTNSAGRTFNFFSDLLDRDLARPTNYFGYLEFVDWGLSTSEPDFYLWILSIDDLNDRDADSIPDFSDHPPRPPLLALKHTETTLLLTISGDIGQVCEVQEASSISATNWPIVLSVTLTNDPHTISLPLPSTETRFWRTLTP